MLTATLSFSNEAITAWGTLLIALAGIVPGAIWVGRKVGPKVWPVFTAPFRLLPLVEEIQKEFATNGGTSLRDAVNRIDDNTNKVAQRITAIVETDTRALIEYDHEGRCTMANRAWCELTGLLKEDAKGFGWLAAVHPGDRYAVGKEWSSAVAQQRDFDMRYRFRAKNQREILVQHRVTWMRDNGATTAMFGTIDVISEKP